VKPDHKSVEAVWFLVARKKHAPMRNKHHHAAETGSADPRKGWRQRGIACVPAKTVAAFSVPIESERTLQLFVLTRFLDANRGPLRPKTL